MHSTNNIFSRSCAPNFNKYAAFVSSEPVTIFLSKGYAVLKRNSDGSKIGFGDADKHDLAVMVRVWQDRYPNHKVL